MEHVIIKTRSLNVWYSHYQALKDINIEIPKNRITALIGASGSGKSTLLRSFNRMLDDVPKIKIEGEVIFNDKNIYSANTDVTALRRKIGMVFQSPTPFPKSIFDNVAYGLEICGMKRKKSGTISGIFKNKIFADELEKSNDQLDVTVTKSLKEVALWDEVKQRLHHSAFRLSGGQQQRLCIARAIAVRPEFLLLDEPCSELDPISTKKIEGLLEILKNNYTIVIVTHNMNQAKRISDYVGFLHSGRLVEFGTVKDIFDNPKESVTREYVRGEFG